MMRNFYTSVIISPVAKLRNYRITILEQKPQITTKPMSRPRGSNHVPPGSRQRFGKYIKAKKTRKT